jgi:hypothetical protein
MNTILRRPLRPLLRRVGAAGTELLPPLQPQVRFLDLPSHLSD